MNNFAKLQKSQEELGKYSVEVDVLGKICDALNIEITLTDKAAE